MWNIINVTNISLMFQTAEYLMAMTENNEDLKSSNHQRDNQVCFFKKKIKVKLI